MLHLQNSSQWGSPAPTQAIYWLLSRHLLERSFKNKPDNKACLPLLKLPHGPQHDPEKVKVLMITSRAISITFICPFPLNAWLLRSYLPEETPFSLCSNYMLLPCHCTVHYLYCSSRYHDDLFSASFKSLVQISPGPSKTFMIILF